MPPPPKWVNLLWAVGILMVVLALLNPGGGSKPTSLTYTDWKEQVRTDAVKTAVIEPTGRVTGELAGGKRYTSRLPVAIEDDGLLALLAEHKVAVSGKAESTSLGAILLGLLPFVLLVALFVWFSRRATRGAGGLLSGFGASKAKVYDEERPTTRFADVAGYEGAKREISEIVDFLRNPDRYKAAGATGPRGVLMVGPPGTGKTLLARAVAGEAKVPVLVLTGSSFVEMFVGVGAARVRDLFATARKHAPVIIFIDEIDALGERRGGRLMSNDEREQTLNQLLSEMDGFDPATGVVVLAATNRPELLDPALLRPGRFDRQVEIPLPNAAERAAILKVHAKAKHLDPDVDLDAAAKGMPGFSGADLANVLNEAAIVAVRSGRTVLTAADLDEARDRVLLGRRDGTNALLPDEKRSVAIHEAGHALVAALSKHADPVAKVTILPRGAALGATEQLPVDERHLYSERYLKDALAVRLGGRAAELLVAEEVSTGAANDLADATRVAVRMVREYGMSKRLGPQGFASGSGGWLDSDGMVARPYAEDTQRVVDEEVEALLREAEQRATTLLGEHRRALDHLIDDLLAHETLGGDAVAAAITAEAGR